VNVTNDWIRIRTRKHGGDLDIKIERIEDALALSRIFLRHSTHPEARKPTNGESPTKLGPRSRTRDRSELINAREARHGSESRNF